MTEPSTLTNAGLFTRDGSVAPVPLAGVSIDAEISGFCARVALAHRYVNRETAPIEAVYVFPLDEGAPICGFEAVVDGTLVIGEVQEREMAALVSLQAADGSWGLDADLAAVLGRDLVDLDRALAESTGAPEHVRRAWATARALAWLHAHAMHVEAEWRMLAAKSRKWIDEVTAAPPGGGTWIDAARQFL